MLKGWGFQILKILLVVVCCGPLASAGTNSLGEPENVVPMEDYRAVLRPNAPGVTGRANARASGVLPSLMSMDSHIDIYNFVERAGRDEIVFEIFLSEERMALKEPSNSYIASVYPVAHRHMQNINPVGRPTDADLMASTVFFIGLWDLWKMNHGLLENKDNKETNVRFLSEVSQNEVQAKLNIVATGFLIGAEVSTQDFERAAFLQNFLRETYKQERTDSVGSNEKILTLFSAYLVFSHALKSAPKERFKKTILQNLEEIVAELNTEVMKTVVGGNSLALNNWSIPGVFNAPVHRGKRRMKALAEGFDRLFNDPSLPEPNTILREHGIKALNKAMACSSLLAAN